MSTPTPLIVNLAPTGMVPTRALSAHVPLRPEEIVRDVLACAEVGISSAHLHARDDDGHPSHRKEVYARIIGGIRDRRPDLVLCVSCSGRNGASLDQRAEVLTLPDDLRPDMASLTLSSLNFASGASLNAPDIVTGLAARMKEHGVRPELEVFDLGMANYLGFLAARGLIEPPFYANILLGNVASAQASFLEIGALTAALPKDMLFSLGGIGATQLPVAAMAAAAAPGLRIGLEDNLWFDAARRHPASNAGLIERAHSLAAAVGRAVMSPRELRERLGLPRRG
ncbi:MAG: 3-keto-5-aminohexanoate cleavage protein [Xanthobacteraceae bacterium]|nr:MAG: 3-keto-5-aminohexanoate cleavage protein [Xanthobacteraceae bacterium]